MPTFLERVTRATLEVAEAGAKYAGLTGTASWLDQQQNAMTQRQRQEAYDQRAAEINAKYDPQIKALEAQANPTLQMGEFTHSGSRTIDPTQTGTSREIKVDDSKNAQISKLQSQRHKELEALNKQLDTEIGKKSPSVDQAAAKPVTPAAPATNASTPQTPGTMDSLLKSPTGQAVRSAVYNSAAAASRAVGFSGGEAWAESGQKAVAQDKRAAGEAAYQERVAGIERDYESKVAAARTPLKPGEFTHVGMGSLPKSSSSQPGTSREVTENEKGLHQASAERNKALAQAKADFVKEFKAEPAAPERKRKPQAPVSIDTPKQYETGVLPSGLPAAPDPRPAAKNTTAPPASAATTAKPVAPDGIASAPPSSKLPPKPAATAVNQADMAARSAAAKAAPLPPSPTAKAAAPKPPAPQVRVPPVSAPTAVNNQNRSQFINAADNVAKGMKGVTNALAGNPRPAPAASSLPPKPAVTAANTANTAARNAAAKAATPPPPMASQPSIRTSSQGAKSLKQSAESNPTSGIASSARSRSTVNVSNPSANKAPVMNPARPAVKATASAPEPVPVGGYKRPSNK